MPKKTFHLPDEHKELYDEAKRVAGEFGETISSVIVGALSRYVEERADSLQGVKEHIVWEGTKLDKVESVGRYVRFYAKQIAHAGGEHENEHYYWETLYFTKKKKYLVVRESWDGFEGETRIEYADTVAELSKNGLLTELIEQLRTSREAAEFLDV